MNSLHEIGVKKITKFLWYSFLYSIFTHAWIPPIRTLLLRLYGAKVGKGVVIHNISFFNLYYNGFNNLSIGDYCYLGAETMIDLADKVILENHVTLSNRVHIVTHTNVGYNNHPLQRYINKFNKSVICRNGSFIGSQAILLPGVIIGKLGVVGAGAVVRKNVADKTVVAGVPAKKIKILK